VKLHDDTSTTSVRRHEIALSSLPILWQDAIVPE
jgi:hypothetical protein